MRYLVLAFLIITSFVHADAASVKAYIATQVPNNNSRQVTPLNIRNSFDAVIDGAGSLSTNISATNISTSAITVSGSLTATSITASSIIGGTISASYVASGTTNALPITDGDDNWSLRRFGMKYDGVTDDAASLKAAVAYSVSQSLTGPKATARLNSPVSINLFQKSYDLNGGYWNVASITSATTVSTSVLEFIKPVSLTNLDTQGAVFSNKFSGLNLIGSDRSSSMDGMKFSIRNVTTYNTNIDGFKKCHVYGDNSYIINHYSVWLNHCKYGVYSDPGSNLGEGIRYFGGGVANGETGIYYNNPNGTLFWDGGSIDYNNNATGDQPQNVDVVGGAVTLNNMHMETQGSQIVTPTFIVRDSPNAILRVTGGLILYAGTGPFTGTSSSLYVGLRGTADFRNVEFQNTSFSGGCFKNGPGYLYITASRMNNFPSFGDCVSPFGSPENILGDGGFEKNTLPLVDQVSIVDDSAPIVSPVSGTNISLTIVSTTSHTGTNSLQITKAGNNGSKAKFVMLVPLRRNGDMVVDSFYYSKPCTQTGSIFVSRQWFIVNGNTVTGVPNVTSQTTISTVTIASTSATIPWTKVSTSAAATQKPPLNATHFGYFFNMDSMNAGCLAVDTHNANEL